MQYILEWMCYYSRPQYAKTLDIARCYLQMNKPNAEDLVHKEATVNERKQFALNYYMVENVQVKRTGISIFSNDPLQLKGTLIIMKLLQSTQTFCYFRSLSYHFHCKKRYSLFELKILTFQIFFNLMQYIGEQLNYKFVL